MALKYWFEFTDVQAIKHRCEIYKDDFEGDSLEVNGSLSLTKSSTDDTLESIRGGGLTIDLEANLNLKFEDFYTENERVFSVKYIRNNVELFYGWLSPEGLVESFVEDTWIISLDCTDGLGFLANLSYVDNATGLPFSGKQKMMTIVLNCLKRTNLVQDTFISIGVFYEGLSEGLNILNETYLNADRFIKDDENTYMNCDEVLRSVLEMFGACITQRNGSWYIYKPNELFNNSELTFFGVDLNGVALSPAKYDIDFAQVLGSQIKDFYPHHINKNQQLTIDSSIGAYRVNYKYGLIKGFLNNIYLQSTGNGTSISYNIDEWIILKQSAFFYPSDNLGINLYFHDYENIAVIKSDSYNINEGDTVSLEVYYSLLNSNPVNNTGSTVYFRVTITDGIETYYLKNDSSWSTSDSKVSDYTDFPTSLEKYFTKESLITPISGEVSVEIYRPAVDGFGSNPSENYMFVRRIELKPSGNNIDSIKGENHTFQVIEKPSSKIEDTKEVYNGDNPSDIYIGTIYESDQTTPTDFWNRKGETRVEIPLLQIMGEERMKMYAKPLRVFSGDIFGYVDYLSVINIDGLDGVKFMPIEYKYDALNNITTITHKQILNNDIGTDNDGIDYQYTLDYGNVVEPTIKG